MEIQRTISTLSDSTLDYLTTSLVLERGLNHKRYASWPSDVTPLSALKMPEKGVSVVGSLETPYSLRYLLSSDAGLVQVSVEGGSASVAAYSELPDSLELLVALARVVQAEHEAEDSMMVPICFWSHSDVQGPGFVRRDLDGLCWEDVADNYAEPTRHMLQALLTNKYRPTSAGQLFLWTGPPGSGKTTALRVMAHEWRDWCDLHYIADPEKFFGSHADYMIQVLLRDDVIAGRVRSEDEPPPEEKRWKLLILEDAGEFLQPTAKTDATAPALARFLNVVDGLIGRGLRTLVLVTTNEPVKDLHEAVRRPGRCAADVRFEKLSAMEAAAWIETYGNGAQIDLPDSSMSIADLYALVSGMPTDRKREPVGFIA